MLNSHPGSRLSRLAAIDESDPDLALEDGTVEPGLRRFGHAKEGTWAPQVVVALAVTREGLPVRSWVLPGNTNDSTVVKRIREDLRGWRLNRVLMVGDAGMDSLENRAELARACGRYVLAVRAGSLKEVKEVVLSRSGRYKQVADNLRVKEVVVGDGELRRRYVVCHNPPRPSGRRSTASRSSRSSRRRSPSTGTPTPSASGSPRSAPRAATAGTPGWTRRAGCTSTRRPCARPLSWTASGSC